MWAYMCCEEDLHFYEGEDLTEILEWNKEADEEGLPKYKLFDNREEALASIIGLAETKKE